MIDKLWSPGRNTVPWHDKLHWWVGRIAFGLSFVAIPTGLNASGIVSSTVMAIWYVWAIGVVLVLGFGVVGVYRWRKNRNKDPHGTIVKVASQEDTRAQPQMQKTKAGNVNP